MCSFNISKDLILSGESQLVVQSIVAKHCFEVSKVAFLDRGGSAFVKELETQVVELEYFV